MGADIRFQPTIMDVSLNGVTYPNTLLYRQNGALCLPLEHFPALATGRLPETALLHAGGTSCLAVASVPGSSVRIDEKALRAEIRLDTRYLTPSAFAAYSETAPSPEAAAGLYSDYTLLYQQQAENYSYAATLGANLFSPYGILRSNHAYSGTQTQNAHVRLDTQYVLDLPETVQSLRIGDVIGGRTTLSGGFRMGGIQLARDFSTRPDMLTMPLPTYASDAALPSAVDAFVNGSRVFQRQIEPGPFEISGIPTLDGAGELTVVVKDIHGVQQVTTVPFYTDATLLRPGLSDYAFEAGYLRYGFGTENVDYRDFVASGVFRQGISSALTAEINALTFNDNGGRLGIGATLSLLDFLTMDTALAGSSYDGETGHMAEIGIGRKAGRYSISARSQWASEHFLQPGFSEGGLREQSQLFAGYQTPRAGSFSAGYATQKYEGAERVSLASAGYANTLCDSLYLSLNVSYMIAPESDLSAQISLSLPLGGRTTLSSYTTAADARTDQRLTLQRTLPTDDGFGYRISGAYSDPSERPFSGDATASYQNRYARFSAGIANADGQSTYRATMEGSVTLMDRRLHFNRRANESFGAVRVGGLEGVRVYAQNQLVGRTDADGYLFIPSLLPYQRNKIAIDPRDIPFVYELGATEVSLTPYRHSGIGYAFTVTKSTSAIMHVNDASGNPIETGTRWTLDDSATDIVGTKGMVYLKALAPGTHTLRLGEGSGACSVEFLSDETASDRFLIDLGAYTCKEAE